MTRQPTPEFPTSFVWGTATAAYQIEGAVAEDGRGPSIWDEFCDRPGVVVGGDTGTVAADHYHRWESDIELMNQLGLDAYRLSLSWSRILPTGSGAVNAKGLDFYDRLIDRLCSVGITPAVSLFHWDLPLALQEQGGWMNRDTSYRLGEYAQVVGERLSDRVGMWMPLNEPVVHTLYGHALGVHAPGLALGFELSKPHITSCSGMASLSKRFGQPDARTSESPRTMLRCVPLRIRRKT